MENMMNFTSFCLVIPLYNEEENLIPLAAEIESALKNQSRSWKVIFIDDGSWDKSLEVLRKLAEEKPWVHYLAFEKNHGQSAAFAAGFKEANAEAVITLDADLQNDPADIPALLEKFDQGFDMVIGWRTKRQDSAAKRYASLFANWVRNYLTRENVKDTGCSLKVLRADMAENIPMFRGMHRFLPTLMKMQGATVAEVQVSHRPRIYGESKYGLWDRAFSGLYDLLAVRWMQDRHLNYTIKEKK